MVDEYDYIHITGEIFNNGEQPAQLNRVAGAVFDADGLLISGQNSSTYMHYIDPAGQRPLPCLDHRS